MPFRTAPYRVTVFSLLLACAAPVPALAQMPPNGAAVYQAKCSLCHDSGAGAAPRITHLDEWTTRLTQTRGALHEVAIKGKPGTAMAAKGGFAELSDMDVRMAVDFMLTRLNYKEVVASAPAAAPAAASNPTPASPAAGSGPVDDASIAEKIRAAYAATNGGVSTRVQIESSGGNVTLRGMVRDNDALKRAEDLARAVPGVKNVDNKLVSAAVFQWD